MIAYRRLGLVGRKGLYVRESQSVKDIALMTREQDDVAELLNNIR